MTFDPTSANILSVLSGNIRITSGSLSVGSTLIPSSTGGRIDASNDIVAYSTSDIRLKENMIPIEDSINKVLSLTGVNFNWIKEHEYIHGYKGKDVGIIAQEVYSIIPEAVRVNETGYLSVRYEKIVPLLIEAIKEQQKQIEELKYLLLNK